MATEVWTPVRMVQWATGFLGAKGIPSARLDAEVLVAHVLGTDRMGVYLQHDRPLDPGELSALRDLFRRRSERVPVAYLTGRREFFRHVFRVTPDVLIPRPETEHLVEAAIARLKELPEDRRSVLDLGTGSGCIALSLALEIPCRVWAVDASPAALAVARENSALLGCRSVEFREGDWFDALGEEDPARFSVIVSNPPYVLPEEEGELEPEVLKEPRTALFPGKTGMECYRRIAEGIPGRIEAGGTAFIELHAKQADNIKGIFMGTGPQGTRMIQDLQGWSRVLVLDY